MTASLYRMEIQKNGKKALSRKIHGGNHYEVDDDSEEEENYDL